MLPPPHRHHPRDVPRVPPPPRAHPVTHRGPAGGRRGAAVPLRAARLRPFSHLATPPFPAGHAPRIGHASLAGRCVRTPRWGWGGQRAVGHVTGPLPPPQYPAPPPPLEPPLSVGPPPQFNGTPKSMPPPPQRRAPPIYWTPISMGPPLNSVGPPPIFGTPPSLGPPHLWDPLLSTRSPPIYGTPPKMEGTPPHL